MPTNCLSVVDHFVGLALKELISGLDSMNITKSNKCLQWCFRCFFFKYLKTTALFKTQKWFNSIEFKLIRLMFNFTQSSKFDAIPNNTFLAKAFLIYTMLLFSFKFLYFFFGMLLSWQFHCMKKCPDTEFFLVWIRENKDQKKLRKVTIKNANFLVLIVSCLRTHQRKYFTLNN